MSTKKNTVKDIEDWLDALFQASDLIISEHRLKSFKKKVWGIQAVEHKNVFNFIIIEDENPEIITLEMRSVLGKVPPGNEQALYQRCLELNYIFITGSIALNEAEIWFVQKQHIRDITIENLASMFVHQMSNTEKLDEILSDEFKLLEMGSPKSN
ncbi:MAG: hypothetical protein ISR88_09295 [Candidatus Marinimicrobia bacterium]|nr:hypothetical protein [Candidatus Neomarinimicrobiota bacterium]